VLTRVEGIRSASLLDYDPARFPFARWLAHSLYKVARLEKLHKHLRRHKESMGQSGELGYDDNLRLREMMQRLKDDSPFYLIYHAFVRQVIAPAFSGKISYSQHPKMRVHLAGTSTVSTWHRDSDVTGRLDQINVWLPFTDAFESNSLHVESDYGLGDHGPVKVDHGQALIFDGGCLSHGTVANETDVTRVSLDFRFAILGDSLPINAIPIFEARPPGLRGD
jgi:hypothetical protein